MTNLEPIPALFKDIKYYLIGKIDDKVIKLLDGGGAKRDHYMSEMITHVIADDASDEEYNEAKDLFQLPVITSRWVILSIKCGVLLPLQGFSPDNAQIFAGVTACPSQLGEKDCKQVWGMITFNGGHCQLELNKHVTHLICTKASGSKYETAMRHEDKVKIVTPDWVTDCMSRKLHQSEDKYHPRLIIVEKPKPPPPQFLPLFHPIHGTPRSPGSAAENAAHMQMLSLSPGHAGMTTPQRTTPTPMDGTTTPKSPRSPRGETSKTKEALARMVNSRIQASGKAFEGPETPPGHGMMPLNMHPVPGNGMHSLGMPGICVPGVRPLAGMSLMQSGLPQMTVNMAGQPPLQQVYPPSLPGSHPGSPRAPRPSSPRTLRNITNNDAKSPTRNKARPMRPMSPGRGGQMVPHMTTQGTLGLPSFDAYFGHDISESVPEDLCLLGSVFYVADYVKYLEAQQLDTWTKVITQYGGQVDESYSNRITHVLCEHQKCDVFSIALKDQKRVITAHWLNDCLLKKKMLPPWLAVHLPSLYGGQKPCAKQVIAVSNFEGADRIRVKHMIGIIGAQYTSYFTRENSVLICKKADGEKHKKAVEWSVPVVNIQWLNDIVLGDLSPLQLPIKPMYQQFSGDDNFRIDYAKVASLMEGWRTPLRIPREAWKRFGPSQLLKKTAENLENTAKKKKVPTATLR